MLETILDKQILFVLMGILTVIGIVSKCVANTSLKRMVRAAGNMGKTTHPLMRLVRAKFEHACMISERVENVRVFVDKYLYEYKVAGLKLHTWRRHGRSVPAAGRGGGGRLVQCGRDAGDGPADGSGRRCAGGAAVSSACIYR